MQLFEILKIIEEDETDHREQEEDAEVDNSVSYHCLEKLLYNKSFEFTFDLRYWLSY